MSHKPQQSRIEKFIESISTNRGNDSVILLDAEMDTYQGQDAVINTNEVCTNTVKTACSPNTQRCFNSIGACSAGGIINQGICDTPHPVVSLPGCSN